MNGNMVLNKKPLAFLLGITPNLAFAAGNVALNLNKYMRDEDFEIVIYYTDLYEKDRLALTRIPRVRLVQFHLPEKFVAAMLAKIPPQSRFRDVNKLMCFTHFEVFPLLREYKNVVWLDADVAVQANLKTIVDFAPFGITGDEPWTVQENFTAKIEGYDMDVPGFCSAVMIVNDVLPYEMLHEWCYDTALKYAEYLKNPDQGIFNLLFQEFDIRPNEMPHRIWQCISWRDEANIAFITHFGTERKVWNTENICNAFPEWYRTHQEWLRLGGSDFPDDSMNPRNILHSLEELDQLREEKHKTDNQPPSRVEQLLDKKIIKEVKKTIEPIVKTKKISHFLRKNTSKLLQTKAWKLHKENDVNFIPDPPREFVIAFHISGGIGDHLIAARYVRDVMTAVGNIPFDIHSSRPTLAKWVFSSFPTRRKIYNEDYIFRDDVRDVYPVAVRLTPIVASFKEEMPWKEIEARSPELEQICRNIVAFGDKIPLLIANIPYLDGYLGQIAQLNGWNRMDAMHHISKIPYGGDALNLHVAASALSTFDLKRKKYITVHNGFDENFLIEGKVMEENKSTKTYPHFEKVVAGLRKKFPDLVIVQLGVKTSTPIDGVDVSLLDKTSLRQTVEILENSYLHIDGESGLVHIAASMNTKSCVIFGPTSPGYFGYTDNINLTPTFCGNCWWMTADWMRCCPRDFKEARCLSELPPQMVVDAVTAYLCKEKIWSRKEKMDSVNRTVSRVE